MTYQDKMRKVAEILGAKFEDTYSHGGHIVLLDGVKIWARYSGHSLKDKFAFVGTVERSNEVYTRDVLAPVMNCSHDKTPEAIAADLKRRMLPGLIEFAGVVKTRLQESDDINAKREAMAKVVTDIVGKGESTPGETISFHLDHAYGSVQVSADGASKIEIRSVDRATMERVLKALVQS